MATTQVYLLLCVLMLFIVANTFILRLSCRITNYVACWTPESVRLATPRYRTCTVIVFGVLLIAGLIISVSEILIGSWAKDLFPKGMWNFAAASAEALLFIKLISWGLSDEQPVPTRLVSIASVLHVVLVATMCLVTGLVLHSTVFS